MGLSDSQAAALINQALPGVAKGAKMMVQLIGKLETSYGRGWSGAGAGSFNWGAITGTYQGQYFESGDSRPDPDHPGQQIKYVTKFRKYPSDAEWIRDIHDLIKKRYPDAYKAGVKGDWVGISRGLYGYYLGTKPKEGAIADHAKRILELLPSIVKVWGPLDSPFVDTPSEPLSLLQEGTSFMPVLRLGSEGCAVGVFQKLSGLEVTGQFGAAEREAACKLQAKHSIPIDGVIGRQTWPLLLQE